MARRAFAVLIALLAVAALAVTSIAPAQTPEPGDQRDRLASANAEAEAARKRFESLKRQASAARDTAQRARMQQAAIAARVQLAEAEIVAARARIALVNRDVARQQARLAEQQEPILKLVAALQSLARRPPALGLVQPGSVRDAAHVRAVMGGLMPVIRERSAAVRGEVDRARRLAANARLAARTLTEGRDRLETARLDLVRIEADNRLRSRDLDRGALVESDKALALGERARDIVSQMDTLGAAAQVRESLDRLPGPLPRPAEVAAEAASAATATQSAGLPPYRLPVQGRLVQGLGELDASGARSRGLTLETWPGAEIVAPTGGRVLYAGRFRAYGQIAIIDHGNGWTSLIANLGQVGVRVGQEVRQGSPIGRAPQGENPRVTVELRRKGRPVDLIPLLG